MANTCVEPMLPKVRDSRSVICFQVSITLGAKASKCLKEAINIAKSLETKSLELRSLNSLVKLKLSYGKKIPE